MLFYKRNLSRKEVLSVESSQGEYMEELQTT